MLGKENHSNSWVQRHTKQLFHQSCTWFDEVLLESTLFPTFPFSHSAVSGSDRTALMCDTRDRVTLHTADSMTRIACERARTYDYP